LSASARVGALSIGLCALGLGLTRLALPFTPAGHGVIGLPWWTLVIAFALAEMLVVHIEVRDQAHTLTLVEIPLLLALFFASPEALLVGRLLGEGAVLIGKVRQAPLKVLFNLSLFLAESGLTLVVFSALAHGRGVAHPISWLAGLAAVLAANLLGVVTVATVIRWHGGRQDLLELGLSSTLTSVINASLAVNAALLVSVSRLAVGVLFVIVGLSYVAYRGYVALRQRYDNITSLFAFTRIVNDAHDPSEILDAMLSHTCELLRAERAEITIFATSGEEPTVRSTGSTGSTGSGPTGSTGSTGPTGSPGAAEPTWRSAAELPGPLLAAAAGERPTLVAPRGTRNPDLVAVLERLGAADAMVTPLRLGEEVIGTLVVAHRMSDVSTFDIEDGRTFATLADHASIAIENGRLLERLSDEAAKRAHDARHDALTGLVNRAYFSERLDGVVAAAEGAGRAVLVVLADLEGFREVNDTLGHAAGDRVLVELAARLRASLGPDDVLARLGADEFAWCTTLESPEDEASAVEAAGATVRACLAEAVVVDGLRLQIGVALGYVVAPDHGGAASTLLQRADVALSTAKASSRREPARYDPDRDVNSLRRLALATSLREAIDEGDITVVYQPKTRLTDGLVTGVEALARWQHPEHGFVSPDEFIALAERTSLIQDLTLGVLRRSLVQQARWFAQGYDLSVAVNVSTRVLLDPDFPAKVADLAAAEGADPARLTLEVTESVMMAEPEAMIASLETLAGTGVTISIDDFGTGYSSLAYLQRLPASEVKVDKSFVMPLTASPDAVAIVESIVGLAHSLGRSVVAEGVEDQASWDLLVAIGCDIAQGYYLSRPCPPEALTAWFAALDVPPGARRSMEPSSVTGVRARPTPAVALPSSPNWLSR
jgi:diguanylate cyclase (GGDEF)-like protein